MLTTWTDGVFEIEVDVEGCIECEGREWEVGSAPCASFKKTPDRFDQGKYYPVIREAGSTADYFFLANYHRNSKTQELVFRPRPGFANGKFSPLSVWGTFMPWALPLKAPCRVLWLSAEATEIATPKKAGWSLTLLSDGRGGWTRAPSTLILPNPLSSFERESNAPVLETASMRDWVTWVRTALQNESDCRFAFEFGGLSEEQKWQRVLRWKRGDREEFKRACQMIAYSALEWDVDTDGANFDLTIRPAKPEEGLDIHLDYEPLESRISDSKRVQRLYAWLHQLYIAPSDESLYQHPCIRDWLADMDHRVRFYISPISAHERLENLKRLVEWAEGEGIDGKLKEILNSPRDD